MLNAFFAPKIWTFLSWIFGCIEKRHDKKAEINFKIYNVTVNNYITQISRSKGNHTVKFVRSCLETESGPLIFLQLVFWLQQETKESINVNVLTKKLLVKFDKHV